MGSSAGAFELFAFVQFPARTKRKTRIGRPVYGSGRHLERGDGLAITLAVAKKEQGAGYIACDSNNQSPVCPRLPLGTVRYFGRMGQSQDHRQSSGPDTYVVHRVRPERAYGLPFHDLRTSSSRRHRLLTLPTEGEGRGIKRKIAVRKVGIT